MRQPDMLRPSHKPFNWVVAGTLASLASGCDLLPDMRLAEIKRSLELTVTTAKRVGSGDSADFVFVLANRGRDAISACLGPSRAVSFHSSIGLGSSITSVDHPGCVREFAIRPRESMTGRKHSSATPVTRSGGSRSGSSNRESAAVRCLRRAPQLSLCRQNT